MPSRKDFPFRTRERVLRKNVEAPDLATLKDFFRFIASVGTGMILEEITADSLNTYGEWFRRLQSCYRHADRCRRQKRSLQRKHTLPPMLSPVLSSLMGPKSLDQGRSRGQHQEAEA
jgi:hypothetical protein